MAFQNTCLLVAHNYKHMLFISSFNIITQIYLVCGCFSCGRGKSSRLYQSIITNQAILSLWNVTPVFNVTPAFPECFNVWKSGCETWRFTTLGNYLIIIFHRWTILQFGFGTRYLQTKINVYVTCNSIPFYACFHSAALNQPEQAAIKTPYETSSYQASYLNRSFVYIWAGRITLSGCNLAAIFLTIICYGESTGNKTAWYLNVLPFLMNMQTASALNYCVIAG